MAQTDIFIDATMGAPLDVRTDVRDGVYNIDVEIAEDGFEDDVEDTTWENIETHDE